MFLESDQYFAGLLINNDYYALEYPSLFAAPSHLSLWVSRLQRLFGDKMFGIISSFLFQLRPEIDREVILTTLMTRKTHFDCSRSRSLNSMRQTWLVVGQSVLFTYQQEEET